MAEITLGVKTFEFGDRHGAHLGMKVTAIFAKITTQIASSAMFHQFCTPFWMHKVAALTTNSMFTIIVLVMATHFNRFGSISSYAGIRFGFIVVVVFVVVVVVTAFVVVVGTAAVVVVVVALVVVVVVVVVVIVVIFMIISALPSTLACHMAVREKREVPPPRRRKRNQNLVFVTMIRF